jgi:OOP family OmpA-OmpF porin
VKNRFGDNVCFYTVLVGDDPAGKELMYEKNPGIKGKIQGYTDNIGSDEYNLGLSQRRAEAVEKYLEAKGVDPDAMSAKGYGSANPIASNDTREGRAQNRRVEFRVAE